MATNNEVKIIKPNWPAPVNVCAFTTTRNGGVSQFQYAGMNLAQHVGDCAEIVEKNRRHLIDSCAIPQEPDWLEQTHSTKSVVLEESTDRRVDAAITRQANRVVSIMTADCLPVLFTNIQGTEVAGAHAGWRGLGQGILESTLSVMQSKPSELIAWIGPAIRQENFEVGEDVRDLFLAAYPQTGKFFSVNRPRHYLFDLPGAAEHVLRSIGLTDVYRDQHCSFRDEHDFYSYRRQAQTGRMASLIWINS